VNRPFEVRFVEIGYQREVLFALELVDAVTLARVSGGVKVVADGLRGKPIVNAGGLFVWLKEDVGRLRKISIDPGTLPYQKVELRVDELTLPPHPLPLTTVELPPRADYVFATGVTGLRGCLLEEEPPPRRPVEKAKVNLRWLDDDGVTWQDAPTSGVTGKDGEFVAMVRLAPTDVPRLEGGALKVRLRANRDGNARLSADLRLPEGRVADPSKLNPLIFAWEDMQP
jgi:hypothetical protein